MNRKLKIAFVILIIIPIILITALILILNGLDYLKMQKVKNELFVAKKIISSNNNWGKVVKILEHKGFIVDKYEKNIYYVFSPSGRDISLLSTIYESGFTFVKFFFYDNSYLVTVDENGKIIKIE